MFWFDVNLKNIIQFSASLKRELNEYLYINLAPMDTIGFSHSDYSIEYEYFMFTLWNNYIFVQLQQKKNVYDKTKLDDRKRKERIFVLCLNRNETTNLTFHFNYWIYCIFLLCFSFMHRRTQILSNSNWINF